MGFLGGLIIGLFIGCIAGFCVSALVSANGHTYADDNEQMRYCDNFYKNKYNHKVEDKNEF